jgi:hypothetical protein
MARSTKKSEEDGKSAGDIVAIVFGALFLMGGIAGLLSGLFLASLFPGLVVSVGGLFLVGPILSLLIGAALVWYGVSE